METPFKTCTLICRMRVDAPWEVIDILTSHDPVLAELIAVGTRVAEVIHPADLEHCNERVELAKRQQHPFRCTYRLCRNDGSCIWVAEFGNYVQYDGEGYWDSVITNISQVQSDTERTALAERLDGMGTLAAMMAHNINNVIASVRLCAEMVNLVPNDPDKVVKYTDDAIAAMDQATVPLRALLAFGQKSGKLSQETIPLSALVALGADLARDSLKKTPVPGHMQSNTVIFDDDAKDIWVRANSVAVQRVICELIRNAAEWMPDGGEVRIVARVEQVTHERGRRMIGTALEPGTYGVIEVIDTGTGIAAEDLQLIFDPYFTRRKAASKQSGFGLSIVYGTLKTGRCGLEIETSDTGSIFRVFIPCEPSPGGGL